MVSFFSIARPVSTFCTFAAVCSSLCGQETLPEAGIQDLKSEHFKGVWDKLPDFDVLKPTKKRSIPDGRFIVESDEDRNHFGLRFRGSLLIPSDGGYLFSLDSDDGSRLLLDGKVIIDHDGVHGGNNPRTKAITLTKGSCKLELQYFDNLHGESLEVKWSGPGFFLQELKGSVTPNKAGQQAAIASASNDGLPDPGVDPKRPQTYLTPETAAKHDPDFLLQGEYAGEINGLRYGLQVMAMGNGKFEACLYDGGLPGAGGTLAKQGFTATKTKDDHLVFGKGDNAWKLSEGIVRLTGGSGELKRVKRRSTTLGQEPPIDALYLYDGLDSRAFKNARVDSNGHLCEGNISYLTFGDHHLHLEFRTPYRPLERGQARGNSGVYLQSRYEVQVLDSFGSDLNEGHTGGIYGTSKPKLNMCLPPLSWQTYDVHFTAPRFDAAGKKTANARMTVYLNGVLVQDNVKVPEPTAAAPFGEEGPLGPLHLQDHDNPVRFRNIWVLPKGATGGEIPKSAAGNTRDILINAVPGKLAFDKPRFHVFPGEKINLTLANPDELAHNLVLCVPQHDAELRVADAALKLGAEGEAKGWLPDHEFIQHATRMLKPHQSQTITFTAPDQINRHPFVCTYPGHARVMRGEMVVGKRGLSNITYKYYEGSWDKLPDFSKLSPTHEGRIAGELLDLRAAKREKDFALVFQATHTTVRDWDTQPFKMQSNNGTRLFLDDELVINHDGLHDAWEERKGTHRIKPGQRKLRLEFFNHDGGPELNLTSEHGFFGHVKLNRTGRVGVPHKEEVFHLKVGERPVIQRANLPNTSPRSIAVGLPGGVNYCFDAANGFIPYGWSGGFLDIGPDRGRGIHRGGGLCQILGEQFTSGLTGFPFRLTGTDKTPRYNYQGYRLVKEAPVLLYRYGGMRIEHTITASGERGLTHDFAFKDSPNSPLVFSTDPKANVIRKSTAGIWHDHELLLDAVPPTLSITLTETK